MDRVVIDPHQSPIWFKTCAPIVLVMPLAHFEPQKFLGPMATPIVFVTDQAFNSNRGDIPLI
jgi:hypothetical protein